MLILLTVLTVKFEKFEKFVTAAAILTKISDLNLMIVLSYFVKGHASTPYNNAGMNFN